MTDGGLSAAERERLIDEREHLLTSLDDLDAELAAGDIDRDDYEMLRDDYTARTAALSRALDGATVTRRTPPPSTGSTRLRWVIGVIVVAALASWAMVEFSGARGAGETASGEIRQSTKQGNPALGLSQPRCNLIRGQCVQAQQ